MPIPGVGYLAYCLDTEGNMFGIMQRDTSAA
jgi:predicted enzyme related to lactoylglutathione lyase